MLLYQPGGLGEKELILRQLEAPPEAGSLAEAVQGLRKWSRWRNRAGDLGVQEPDPFLLLKGLNKITRRVLEQHRDLSFRISLARSTLQVDSTPTSRSVTSFALHLLAEFEQIVHVEAGNQRRGGPDKQKTMRMKKMEEAEKEKSPEGEKKSIPKCRFFLTKEGCRRGKSCKFDHDQRDDLRRCYDCGSPDHLSPSCPKKKNDGSPMKPKAARAEVEEERGSVVEDKESGGGQVESDQNSAMKELLEEANRMLKSLTASSEAASSTSTTSQKDEVAERLQRRTESMRMKVLRLSRMGHSVESGLIDSGATHALRPLKEGEKLEGMREVTVTLATGGQTTLRMNREGTMITNNPRTEPILPMGALTKVIKCSLKWNKEGLVVRHPVRGVLPVSYEDGCPVLPRELTLQLIEEIEKQQGGGSVKKFRFEDREEWLKALVRSHPVLRGLPDHIKESLVEEVGDWSDIPANRRTRKRMQQRGMVLHLYAGPDSGVTLRKAMQQNGVDVSTLLEVDLERGEEHDMLSKKGPYRGLLHQTAGQEAYFVIVLYLVNPMLRGQWEAGKMGKSMGWRLWQNKRGSRCSRTMFCCGGWSFCTWLEATSNKLQMKRQKLVSFWSSRQAQRTICQRWCRCGINRTGRNLAKSLVLRSSRWTKGTMVGQRWNQLRLPITFLCNHRHREDSVEVGRKFQVQRSCQGGHPESWTW